jgi:hypothetical protein
MAKLASSATQQSRKPDVVSGYFEEEARFVEAVKCGEDALQRGDDLTHEQVGDRRLRRFRGLETSSLVDARGGRSGRHLRTNPSR